MHFEIIAIGFNGGTDLTDDRILWVEASSFKYIEGALTGVPYKDVCELVCTLVQPEDIDFRLPQDAEQLREKLIAFAVPDCIRLVLDKPGRYCFMNNYEQFYFQVDADRSVHQLKLDGMTRDGVLPHDGWKHDLRGVVNSLP